MNDLNEEYLGVKKEVYTTAKQKDSPDYFKNIAKLYIGATLGRKAHIESARNYYSGIRDEDDFQYLEDIYGMQNPIDLGFTNIIKPRVDALVGLTLLSEPTFNVHYTDKETIEGAKKEKASAIIKDLAHKFDKALQQSDNAAASEQQQQAKGNEPAQEKKPEGISEENKIFFKDLITKYSSDFLSSYEQAAQHIINLIETDAEIDLANIKKDAAEDFFITGEAYVRELYLGEGKDPKMEIALPEEVYTNRPRRDRDLKRASVVVNRKRVSPHHILKELGNKITKKEAEELFSSYSSLSTYNIQVGAKDANTIMESDNLFEMDSMPLKTGWSDESIGALNTELVDLFHVEWLASSKISDGKGGHVYREDRYEVYRVGPDIYIGGRRCNEAPRTKDEPWKTSLSYKGLINAGRNGIIHSLVNSMRELQDLYDIIMFFRNNAIAHSGVSGSRVNTAAIPKALGKKFMDRLTKWITLRKQGIELIDPTEEGAQLFQHYGEFSSSVKGDTINSINAILESLMLQADIVSGVPRQILGIIEERDAVENVRVGLNQVSILNLRMFRDIDRCMSRAVQGTLDNYKYAYRKKPIKGVYKNGAALLPFLLKPGNFSTTDYKVTVISAGIESAKLVKILGMAKEFAAAGLIDADVLVKIINKKSIHEIEYILTKAIAAKKEETQNMGQLQQQLEEATKQIQQLEAEIERLNNNNQEAAKERIEIDKQKVENEKLIKTRELDIKEAQNRKDNKIADKEIVLKKDVVDLEKEQLLFSTGKETEVNNNLI